MPGLQSILNGDSDSKFTLISVEEGPAAYSCDYLSQICKSYADSSRFRLHIISLAYDFTALTIPREADTVHHDFLHNPFPSIVDLLKRYTDNRNTAVRNIMLIDDLQLFLIHTEKDFGRLMYFFKILAKTCQVMALINKDTCSGPDLRFCYSQADTVVLLTKGSTPTPTHFLCNIIKTKYSGKIVHEQTNYEVINGQIRDIPKEISGTTRQNRNQDLSSLTTFKLTVEDDEKESKSRLHLPYFNAQTPNTSDPDFDFFDDEDEEDEEI